MKDHEFVKNQSAIYALKVFERICKFLPPPMQLRDPLGYPFFQHAISRSLCILIPFKEVGLIVLACISTLFQYCVVLEFTKFPSFGMSMNKLLCGWRLVGVWIEMCMVFPLMIGHNLHYQFLMA